VVQAEAIPDVADPGRLESCAVEVPPSISPTGSSEPGEVVGAVEGAAGLVDAAQPGVEVTDEHKRFVVAFGCRL
jgi:hypothetical protein